MNVEITNEVVLVSASKVHYCSFQTADYVFDSVICDNCSLKTNCNQFLYD